MSSGAIWWRGWRRPWHSWSRGEPDNGETTVANLAGGARLRQWRGSGTGQRGRAEQRSATPHSCPRGARWQAACTLPQTRAVALPRAQAAVGERRYASRARRRGHALGHRCPVAHGHCYRTTASTWACRCSALPSLTRAGAGRPQPSINCAATTLPPSAAFAAAIRHVHA